MRFFSIAMRALMISCRSLAALYSAFSRRSPCSRARLNLLREIDFQLALQRGDFVVENA